MFENNYHKGPNYVFSANNVKGYILTVSNGMVFVNTHFQSFYSALVSLLLSGVPDYFDRNKISSGGDLSHYSSASLY